MFGRASAMRRKTSSQWPNSVPSVFRNFRRAGVLKYSSSTVTVVPVARAAGSTSASSPPSQRMVLPCAASRARLEIATRATEAMEASASPRNPIVDTPSRSCRLKILLVAWRASASGRASRAIPAPSSSTCTRRTPPSSRVTAMLVAPASRLFSSSSFRTEAGRSTTSPAAIWDTRSCGSPRMAVTRRVYRIARMEFVATLWDLAVHLDQHLAAFVAEHGAWVYALLFVIVFCETGLGVTPFLPGDSLLFVVGALAAAGGMDLFVVMAVLMAAALCGDNVNYWIGRWAGMRLFGRWVNARHLQRTHDFYEKHGGKTIIIARFMPIIRTYVPFVAGVGSMPYLRYLSFCVIGAVAWVGSICTAGYFFGNIPAVKSNLTIVIFAIVLLSISPAIVAWLRSRSPQ